MDGTTWYGHSKLYVQTFACELGRRLLLADGRPDVAVFSYCRAPSGPASPARAGSWGSS